MPIPEDTLTQLSKRALEVDDAAQSVVSDVTGVRPPTTDELIDVYLMANYEQRQELFTQVLSDHGADGLEMLRDIYYGAFKRWNQ